MAETARNARAVPDGYHSITPALVVDDGVAAIEFYKRAFGAREVLRIPSPDGQRIWHAELQIGDSRFMLGEESPGMSSSRAPRTLGATTGSLHLYVEDADAAFEQAVAAGARPGVAPADMFWGDRYASVIDPFGHTWGLATRKEDVSDEEVLRRAQAFAAQSG